VDESSRKVLAELLHRPPPLFDHGQHSTNRLDSASVTGRQGRAVQAGFDRGLSGFEQTTVMDRTPIGQAIGVDHVDRRGMQRPQPAGGQFPVIIVGEVDSVAANILEEDPGGSIVVVEIPVVVGRADRKPREDTFVHLAFQSDGGSKTPLRDDRCSFASGAGQPPDRSGSGAPLDQFDDRRDPPARGDGVPGPEYPVIEHVFDSLGGHGVISP
jgi:hypothetical protein